ncbi:MAG: phage tail protein [Anaerolinea sp.]|nr:phage tail protein [Anaerolinea sp.]
MTEPYIGQIIMFGGNFAIRGYATCDGQLLPIAQNTALFSILGTTYGGNGQTTFALPDLRGRAPIHMGQGPGLSNYTLGQVGGSETVTLIQSQMPAHNHTLNVHSGTADSQSPVNNLLSGEAAGATFVYSSESPDATANPNSIAPAGGSQPHNNQSPYLTLNFQIALVGVFPSRN